MLRKEVAEMLGRTSSGFPGAQPVSFAAKHLEELKRTDYYLCEKSDGIRCLLYFTRDGDQEVHYLIDRKNDYYWVRDLHFPLPGDDTFRSFHTETLIDGELVLDDVGEGKKLLRFLVFDCLMLDNQRMMHRMLDKRLGYVMERIYKPYKTLCKAFRDEVQFFPFQIEFKKMEFSYSIQWMFESVLPKLPHGNDGLIFTCRTTPYKFGTDPHIIKWKPALENSIDFRLNLEFPLLPPSSPASSRESTPEHDYHAMPTFHLSVFMGDDVYKKWAQMHVTEEEWEGLKDMGVPLDDAIVECAMDKEGRWRYMRFRKDKKHGNHISTVDSVMESVRDAVGREELIAVQAEVRKAWKARAAAVVELDRGEASKKVRR
ncbi:mRNA capping enzyme, catalytic domain-containing protein [Morchella snyderi]|nr:mRNA capping enzyme, catalytic domain-containing protein [Morchella snyderi]